MVVMNNQNARTRRQQGGALLIFMLAVVLAGMATLFGLLDSDSVKIERNKKTELALAKAKNALIGWSVMRGGLVGTARPGELPCPDNDAPGTSGYGVEDGSCVAGKVGRLPWKTIGVEELTDGYGEPLWYVIDGSFRKRPNMLQPINSDTRASLQVYAPDGLTLMTSSGMEAAAIVFAVGDPVSGQSRSPSNSAICPATATNVTENRCATNYLETQNSRSNSINNGPFIKGKVTDNFNDHLTYISASELMKTIEKRVGRELRMILQNYFSVHGYYPYPAKYNDAFCLDVTNTGYFTDCISDTTSCRGRFPDEGLPISMGANLPDWFVYNLWGQTIFYSVGTNSLATAPSGCSAQLSVDGVGKDAIIILAGTPLNATVRNNPSQNINLSSYLEDAENQDGWNVLANDIYTTLSASTNDSLYVLP
ncbi:MAG TPA: hypothetical protein PL131_12120 [Methylotenera sp.]|nr:hypothetical protein [Methylotenera sp.]HPH06609.1 hypothetical protein [Methylotenera sp.]HPN01853.1 hypothetical protein [Methylotenera sp.]